MIITSIYSTEDMAPAFVRLDVTESKHVVLIETWKTKAQGEGLFQAITTVESDTAIFNGISVEGKLHSFLCESAKSKNIKNPHIAKPFSSGDGIEIFRDMQMQGTFAALCDDWETLSVELKRISTHKTARAMAFLQGILAAEREAAKQAVGFGMRLGGGRRSHFDRWTVV